ncbi:MAG TPA: hypothetical protein VN678_05765 [Acidobacteriaceae bacterium]|nr:hypothetical protein [Acidobacteriaceae bacterium]
MSIISQCSAAKIFVHLSLGFVSLFAFSTRVAAQNIGDYKTTENFVSLIGGIEQVDLSSQPSATEPFARFYVQSKPTFLESTHKQMLAWATVRVLGAPNQNDTAGIFSVFTDPTGQITSDKLSSVGAAVDFTLGGSYRLYITPLTADKPAKPDPFGHTIELILGFGATTPLQSNKVNEAFTAPAFGTIECNTLFQKLQSDFAVPGYNIQKSQDGKATNSTNACLLNTNSATTSGSTTTYAPVNIIAFSSEDRTSFFLKDLAGLRWTQARADSSGASAHVFGSVDFTFGMDSAITGGVFRGKRWIFKTDGIYPIVTKGKATFYLFGSFSTRLKRNQTDNSPLILQPAALATVTGTASTAVPNVSTVVLPLRQPDRDFYRIGIGIDLTTLFK